MPDESQPPSLAVRMAKGAGWIIAVRFCSRVMGVVSTVVLVRLLTPADFGLVALASALANSLDAFLVVGVTDALIRDEKPDRELYDTGFTMNLIRCAIVAAIVLAGAFPAARFFDDARLAPILIVIAAMTLLSGFNNIGIVDFRRGLQFEKEFVVALVPRVAGIVVSIVCAAIFANYWALLASIVAMRAIWLVLTYVIHPYRPRLGLRAWRRIVGFSFWTWLSSIVVMARERIDSLAIGKFMGMGAVGVYSIGLEIGTLASTELLEPLSTAMFAGFSAGRREGADNAQGLFKAISVTLMVTLPIGVGLSLVAAPFITLLFGARWAEAIPLAQVFALLGITRLIPYFAGVLLSAHGLIHLHFRIMMAGLCVRSVLLLALIGPLGLTGALIAATACAMVEEILYLWVTFRLFHLRLADLLRGTWRSLAGVAAMALAVWAEGIGWAAPAGDNAALAVDLGIAVLSGAFVYCGAVSIVWRLSGRPEGAETMLLSIVKDTWRHVVPRSSYRQA